MRGASGGGEDDERSAKERGAPSIKLAPRKSLVGKPSKHATFTTCRLVGGLTCRISRFPFTRLVVKAGCAVLKQVKSWIAIHIRCAAGEPTGLSGSVHTHLFCPIPTCPGELESSTPRKLCFIPLQPDLPQPIALSTPPASHRRSGSPIHRFKTLTRKPSSFACTSRNRLSVSFAPTVLRTAGVTPNPPPAGFSSTRSVLADADHHSGWTFLLCTRMDSWRRISTGRVVLSSSRNSSVLGGKSRWRRAGGHWV